MNEDRFQAAVRSVLSDAERERHGIGMQKEKTLHAIFKNYEDPDGDHQEIPVIGNYIADIFTGSEIIEIQNGNFGRMRGKLAAFLPQYPVRIVYPIPRIRWITWVDPGTGEIGKRRRSPRRGTFYDAFRQLYQIRTYLKEPNLTIDLCLTDMEEYRLRDGWSRDGKRGSHRFDRIPKNIAEELILKTPRDYLAFLPPDLPEPFTAADLREAAGIRPGRYSDPMLLLTELGVLDRAGRRGRAYLYCLDEKYRD